MKDNAKLLAILSGGLIIIGLIFFVFSYVHWLSYDSTSPALAPSARGKDDNMIISDDFNKVTIDQIVIAKNPFFTPNKKQEQAGRFPELSFTGLISGERRLAILEEVGPQERSWIVQEGDQVIGAKVIRIGGEEIELSRNGEIIILKIQAGPPRIDETTLQ